ncbi:MAG TPA: hypothetical protein VIK89_05435 [Cytophagaceae bacterium]
MELLREIFNGVPDTSYSPFYLFLLCFIPAMVAAFAAVDYIVGKVFSKMLRR